MAIDERESVLSQIDVLFRRGTIAGLADRELLERFARDGDERAFAALVEWHGAMVERTCRAILRDEHDAQDALQATFLLLARRAGRLRVSGSLGPWLHAVAWRVAIDARKARARRRKHERRAAGLAPARVSSEAAGDAGLAEVLHEEIGWLPARYRAVVVLCDLEGRTHVEAAQLLGCRVGTVKSRQARARARLRRQLTRRGLAPAVGGIGGVIAAETRAAVSHALSDGLARVAAGFVARGNGSTAAGAIAGSAVIAMVKRFDAILGASVLRSVAIALLAVGVATGSAMFLVMGQPPASAPPRDPPKTQVAAVAQLDADGDPLPAGAVARLGRRRFSHGGAVTAVEFQPTGKWIASAGSGHVKLWDASSGRLVRELPAHAYNWQSLAFSPDGSLLASGGDDRTIRVWDVATGRPVQTILAFLSGGSGPIFPFPVAFAPDGKTLASGCINGLIIVWDVATGRESFRLEPPPGGGNARDDPLAAMINALAVSPDGKLLASRSSRTGIQLWDLNQRRPLRAIPNDSFWFNLAFSPDGQTLAWAGRSPRPGGGNGIQLWDLAGDRIRGSLPCQPPTYLGFSRDGRRLAATGADQAVHLWDLGTGKLLKTMTGHTEQTNAVAFSPDGSTVASCSNDGSIRLWDAATGAERFGGPMDHWGQAMCVAAAPDGRSIRLASRDRMIREVAPTAGTLTRSVRVDGDLLESAAVSPDGSKAAVAEKAAIRVYDLSTGRRSWTSEEFRPRPDLPEIDNTETPELVFSGDGRRLVSSTLDLRLGIRQRATVRVWDTAAGRLISQVCCNGYVDAPPVFLDGGRTLVIAETREPAPDQGRPESAAFLGFYETETGRPLREHELPECYSSALAAAPDGSWLAVASGGWVQVLDPASGTLAYTLAGLRFGASVETLAVSPDGTRIAAADWRSSRWGRSDRLVHVWRVADGRRIHELAADAKALAFAPDSRSLITCGADGTALVWDLSDAATAPPTRRPPTDREIETHWALLACGGLLHWSDQEGRGDRVDALAEGGDRTIEFLAPRLLDPKLAQKDEAEVESLWRPLTDRDPKVRAQAAARLEPYGVLAEAYLSETAKVPGEFLDGARRSLPENFRRRRDEMVYHVLRQIGTLRARWLLHRLAEGLPDDDANRNRKQKAAETAAALDGARLRMP